MRDRVHERLLWSLALLLLVGSVWHCAGSAPSEDGPATESGADAGPATAEPVAASRPRAAAAQPAQQAPPAAIGTHAQRDPVPPAQARATDPTGTVPAHEPELARGTLEVRLVDPKRLLDDDARVNAWPPQGSAAVSAGRFDPRTMTKPRGSQPQPFVRGVARLGVAVGSDYVVTLTWHDTTLAQKLVSGPAEAGATVACAIELPADQAQLVARIPPGWVRSDAKLPPGLPGLPKALPYVILHRAGPVAAAASRPRAAQDKFTARVDVANRVTAFPPREWHGVELDWVEVFLDGQTRSVARTSLKIEPGVNDLGLLDLVGPTEVARGRVIDERNNHVIAKIEIVEALEDPSRVALQAAQVLPGGNFVLRAFLFEPPKGPLHARFSNEYLGPVPDVEFVVGTRNLVVVMTQGAHVIAELVLPDGWRAEQLGMALRRQGREPLLTPQGWKTERLGGAGQVRWSGLAAGKYDLLMQHSARPPKVVLAGIAVPESGRCLDPRLASLDLRPLLRD